MIKIKICSKCDKQLDNSLFSKNNNAKDKLCKVCKSCQKQYREENKAKISEEYKKYREKNREKLIEYNKKYYKDNYNDIKIKSKEKYNDNKEWYKEYNESYYKKNKEHINCLSKKYWEENKDSINKRRRESYIYTDEIRNKSKEYYNNNIDKIKLKNKKYNDKNKQKLAMLKNIWRKNNSEKYKEYCRDYHNKTKYIRKDKIRISWNNRRTLINNSEGKYSLYEWEKCLEFFGRKCAYSGEELINNITIDHIIPLSKSGTNYIWNLCPCLKACNSSKKNYNLEEWYKKQDYYSEDRLNKIYKWIEISKNL